MRFLITLLLIIISYSVSEAILLEDKNDNIQKEENDMKGSLNTNRNNYRRDEESPYDLPPNNMYDIIQQDRRNRRIRKKFDVINYGNIHSKNSDCMNDNENCDDISNVCFEGKDKNKDDNGDFLNDSESNDENDYDRENENNGYKNLYENENRDSDYEHQQYNDNDEDGYDDDDDDSETESNSDNDTDSDGYDDDNNDDNDTDDDCDSADNDDDDDSNNGKDTHGDNDDDDDETNSDDDEDDNEEAPYVITSPAKKP
jgi:hypothetical protein